MLLKGYGEASGSGTRSQPAQPGYQPRTTSAKASVMMEMFSICAPYGPHWPHTPTE